MHLKYILEQVPGVNRRFVYYLESQGYIQPTRLPKERIARRDYSEDDLRVIRETWRYYSRGFSLQAAHSLAVKKQRLLTVVTFLVPPKRRREVFERLIALPEVVEAAAVYADSADFIVKFSTPQEADVYQALVPLFAQMGVSGIPQLTQIGERYVRGGEGRGTRNGEQGTRNGEQEIRSGEGGQPHMIAYVLITAPSKTVGQVLTALKEFKEVAEASVIYGESDILARLVTPSQRELDQLVMERIHSIPSVEGTRTYIVVGDLHWARD